MEIKEQVILAYVVLNSMDISVDSVSSNWLSLLSWVWFLPSFFFENFLWNPTTIKYASKHDCYSLLQNWSKFTQIHSLFWHSSSAVANQFGFTELHCCMPAGKADSTFN